MLHKPNGEAKQTHELLGHTVKTYIKKTSPNGEEYVGILIVNQKEFRTAGYRDPWQAASAINDIGTALAWFDDVRKPDTRPPWHTHCLHCGFKFKDPTQIEVMTGLHQYCQEYLETHSNKPPDWPPN